MLVLGVISGVKYGMQKYEENKAKKANLRLAETQTEGGEAMQKEVEEEDVGEDILEREDKLDHVENVSEGRAEMGSQDTTERERAWEAGPPPYSA
jgi:hypothetical protein